MSRWVPVHRVDFLHDELTDESWVDLEFLDQIVTLIAGGSRLVWPDLSTMDVKETAEQLLNLTGA